MESKSVSFCSSETTVLPHIRDLPLSTPTYKVVFLVAITSARQVSELVALSYKEPFLDLHSNNVVLRPWTSFMPRVVSALYLNQGIVLLSLCPASVDQREISLHCLDVV